MSLGRTDEEDPSFQYECFVGLPQVGQEIEPGGKMCGYVTYGLQIMTEGRKKSSLHRLQSPTLRACGLVITALILCSEYGNKI